MSLIYVLHFDTPLAHARHYIGCTENLRARLTAHANGAGSRICRELIKREIGWKLGGLYQCTHKQMRRLERSLKDQKHSSRFCEICNSVTAKFPECTSFPIDMLPFPTASDALRKISTPLTGQTVRVTIPGEPKATMQAILWMMRRDKDALGFVPCGGDQGIEQLVDRGLIALAEAGGEIVGYASHTLNPSGTRVTIHQCCVRDDARLMGLGSQMIALINQRHPDQELVAKVRDDLAANHFWNAIGFKHIQQVIHPTSKNKINHYQRVPYQEDTTWLLMNGAATDNTNSTTKDNECPSVTSWQKSSEKPD
jgi:predicted GIY-YIG superfamily endonuclease/GNAT superfamily N-acetyltransferase